MTDQTTPRTLGFAVWSEDVALVRELLLTGAPVDEYGSESAGITPLMQSVEESEPFYDNARAVITQLILSAGADVNRRDHSARTALHFAAGAGATAVDLLLTAGADPNAVDRRGRTPLHEAIDRGSATAALALCRRGADKSARDNHGKNAADLLASDTDGFTPEELDRLRGALHTP